MSLPSLLLGFALGVLCGAGAAWLAWGRRATPHAPVPLPDPGTVTTPPDLPRPEAPAASLGSDDLTQIRGIGPNFERVLREAGVTSLRQLAELTPNQLAWLDETLGAGERALREDWPGQARALLRSG